MEYNEFRLEKKYCAFVVRPFLQVYCYNFVSLVTYRKISKKYHGKSYKIKGMVI